MTRLRLIALLSVATLTLSACMSENDTDSREGLVSITHTTKGTLYWE